MLSRLFSSEKDLVGVDIGASTIKVVSLKENKGVYELVSLGVAPLPPEAIVENAVMDAVTVSATLKGLLDSLKMKATNVAASVAGHSVIIRKIRLPLMAEEELEQQLQFEAEQYIPFEITDVNIDFQILGPDARDPSQMNVILVAAKKDFVNDYSSLFAEAGLKLRVLDIDCFAVENMIDASYGFSEGEVVALVNVGYASVNINILKGAESVFTRDIQAGGKHVGDEVQKRLGVSTDVAEQIKLGNIPDDIDGESVKKVVEDATSALVQDIQRSLDFFTATAGDDRIHKVWLCGGSAQLIGLRDELARRLGVAVEVANPFRQVQFSDKQFDEEYLKAVGPLFGVAVGLATRRLGDK